MLGGSEKLKLVRELGLVRKGLKENTAGRNKLTLVKRLREIRALLLGDVGEQPKALVIDPANKLAAVATLTDYLKNGINKVPDALRNAEVNTVSKLFELVKRFPGEELSYEAQNEIKELFRELSYIETDSQISTYDYFKAQGSGLNASSEKILAISNEIDTIRKQTPVDSPEIAEQKAEAQREFDNIREKLSDLLKINRSNGYDEESINKAATDYEAYMEKRNEAWDRICQLDREKFFDKNMRIADLKEQINPEGELIINALLTASPITQEQADSWAKSQAIDKAALTRLKKNGYPEADVRRDMAEFYRISRGKLRGIAISSKGDKRANASGIGSVEGSTVYIDSDFNKSTLWHELAHHLEADPTAKFASNGFLQSRRESNKVYSLRSLTGNKGYKKDEGAYRDKWINDYIGKVYRDQTTEVWSMGVQYLSNPTDAALLYAKDPDMAALMAGYLSTELSPAMKAYQVLQDSAANVNQDARNDQQKLYDEAVVKLAARVHIVDDGWFDGLEEEDRDNILKLKYYSIGDDVKFIGSWKGFRVFSGKIKKYGTKRKAKGYAVGYTLRTGTMLTGEKGMFGSSMREVFQTADFHGSVDEMKAAMEVAKERMNNDIYRADRELFYYSDGQAKMIQYANEIIGWVPND